MSHFVYVALGGENRIAVFAMEPATGGLRPAGEVPLPGGPGPLAIDPGRCCVYAGLRSTRQLCAFRLDATSGALSLIGTVDLGADPCYLSMDRRGRYLLSASYSGGLVGVHRIAADGSVATPPVEWRTTAPCAHSIQTDPTNRFAFVPHVAESNVLFQFTFDEVTGRLAPNPVPRVAPPEGTGPRHYEFHPSLPVLYCGNEQGSSVTAYRLDPEQGTLEPFQTLSTLPEGFTGENTTAQIHLAPPGRFLYVSNRGHDSIAAFAVESGTGRLSAIGHQTTEPMPRAFNHDPYGRYLYAGGLTSGQLASYRIDPHTGVLTPLEIYAVGKNPMWVLPVRAAAV
jgi:6-phosphogluconolactonase